MKDSYSFSGHTDFWRRFGSQAEYVGNTENGKSVSWWRDALWITYERSGACINYVAQRITPEQVTQWRNTKAAYAARGLEKPQKPKPFVCDLELGGDMQGTLKTR